VFSFRLPPLRERRQDIVILVAKHFIEKHAPADKSGLTPIARRCGGPARVGLARQCSRTRECNHSGHPLCRLGSDRVRGPPAAANPCCPPGRSRRFSSTETQSELDSRNLAGVS
jgi:hypothetical protein